MNLPNQTRPIKRNQIVILKNVNETRRILPSDDWDCYSARKCSGKIINHKDPHNCKNSGGKSDYNNRTGDCTSW
jgi:hypothetical protein